MAWLDAVAILLAGLAAGGINAVVGSGTLITFPTLLALGYPPVIANVSNTVGLAPGSFAGAWGYRRELTGQRKRLLALGALAMIGGALGAVLLLTLPESAFRTIVPALIGIACVLVVVQPWLTRRLGTREGRPAHGGVLLSAGVLGTGVYGGYFGAAQGVLLIAVLALGTGEPLQRVNAVKNVLAGVVNGVAAVVFIAVTEVDWAVAGLIGVGSVAGGVTRRVGRAADPGAGPACADRRDRRGRDGRPARVVGRRESRWLIRVPRSGRASKPRADQGLRSGCRRSAVGYRVAGGEEQERRRREWVPGWASAVG